MKKFNFNLEALLQIRKIHEEEIQNELAKILIVQNREKISQDKLRDNIEQQQGIYRKKMTNNESIVTDAILFEKFVDVAVKAIDTAQKRIEKMEPEINEIRERLIEASRERKVVEKLRERKRAEYDYELNREIDKDNDEMNQARYFRQKRESA